MAFSQLPSQPGVYWWLGKNKDVLYVGKAKNLKNRVNSYRVKKDLVPRIREMTETARYLQWRVLPSEVEALLVEAELIRTYQPPFNVLLKDDKSPLYVVITREKWPRVLKMRKRDLEKKKITGRVFGPFPSAYKVSEVLKLVRPIFPWCNAPRRAKMRRCLENHLELCPGVCSGAISAVDYGKIIDNLSLFLAGKKKGVETKLKRELKERVLVEDFEAAAKLRDQLSLIAEITDAKKRLKEGYFLPNLSSLRQENALIQLKAILREHFQVPREYQVHRIEGYDVSNTSGLQAVVSMVVFTDGEADKSEYRSFNIRSLETPNDFAMMAEALGRRANHVDDWRTPDLFLIDGGKGQVKAVLRVLQDTDFAAIPVIGLAKDPDRLVIPTWTSEGKLTWEVLNLGNDNLALQLLQQVRDEAHRFGKSKHTKRRDKADLGLA